MGCIHGLVGAGCPDRVHGNVIVCAGRCRQGGGCHRALAVLSYPERAVSASHPCSYGDAQPCLEVLEDTCLPMGLCCPWHHYMDIRKALPPWPQRHGRVGGTGTLLAIILGTQKPVNYPIHSPLLFWLFVVD